MQWLNCTVHGCVLQPLLKLKVRYLFIKASSSEKASSSDSKLLVMVTEIITECFCSV